MLSIALPELRIPASRFGISPDKDVEAWKKKYIDCIIKELGSRTKNINNILKCFDVTHKSLADAYCTVQGGI